MRSLSTVLAAALGLLLYSTAGHAQATRTWVSGVGDDANPCSRTAPCKTFAGAISKTAAGGEISVLDPGGFGAVTITKSITINGEGTLAGILAAGVNGVIVSSAAPATAKITLRKLSINGVGTGVNGVRVLGGAQTNIDQCVIDGFTGSGVDVAPGVVSEVYVTDSYITNAGNGVALFTSAASLLATISNTTIANITGTGVLANGGNVLGLISRSTINGAGGTAVSIAAGAAQIGVDSSNVSGNANGFNAGTNGSIIRISNNNMYSNATGMTIAAGGTIASTQDNRTGANGAGAPNAVITKQ